MSPFEALAEPNRRRILDALMAGERPAGDLVEALALSQPGVSKHLKILKAAGLVRGDPADAGSTGWTRAVWPSASPGCSHLAVPGGPRLAAGRPSGA